MFEQAVQARMIHFDSVKSPAEKTVFKKFIHPFEFYPLDWNGYFLSVYIIEHLILQLEQAAIYTVL